ncbi:DUF6528 family protein [Streptomyces sp. NPDC051554]|uniref:DUF6528 family protein n=1 Tax=Streptomyces sp. NPDC051554 TaxID=3365656 RepID=UPI003787DD55
MTRLAWGLLGLLGVVLPASVFTAPSAVAGGSGPAKVWPGTSRIVVTDQATRTVTLLDPEPTLWQRPAEQAEKARWTWSATDDPELADLDPQRTWKNPSEATTRFLNGRQYLLAGASGGLAAVIGYPDGHVYWATDAGNGNVHSLELLPDGNVAVSASTPGVVRLYTASQGPRSSTYAEFTLPGAHSVHWDPLTRRLWALGTRNLVVLAVTGPPDAPHLTPVQSVALPTSGGHDLSPVHSSPGRMWVTTNSGVYQYSPAQNAFVPYPGQDRISHPGVKSIGDDPATGQVLTTAPAPGNPCAWCTSTLTLYNPDGTRILINTQLYKARWWTTLRY